MNVSERNAVDALSLRVNHASAIAGLLAQINHHDPDVGTALEGISDMLAGIYDSLREITDPAREGVQ